MRICEHCGTDNRFKTSTNCASCGAPLPPIEQEENLLTGHDFAFIGSTNAVSYIRGSTFHSRHSDPAWWCIPSDERARIEAANAAQGEW